MNNYLISMVNTEDPYSTVFYKVKGMNEEEAKYNFIQKTFKALSDSGYGWEEIEDLLASKDTVLIITDERVIGTIE